VGRFYSEPGAV